MQWPARWCRSHPPGVAVCARPGTRGSPLGKLRRNRARGPDLVGPATTASHAVGESRVLRLGAPIETPENARPRPPTPPAGWYQDPRTVGQQRWWDGQAWTDHVAIAPVVVNVHTTPTSSGRRDTWQPAHRPPLQLEPDKLVGVGRRLGAFLVDQVVLLTGLIAVALISAPFGDEPAAFLLLLWFVAAVTYTVVYPATCGQTLGKYLLGVQLIDTATHSTRIGYGSVLIRELVRGLGLYPLAAGWWWALFDRYRQTWHDKAASTAVVKAAPRTTSVPQFLAVPFSGARQGRTATGQGPDSAPDPPTEHVPTRR